jgi:prepilin-type N-terminal cleavage/methylation domain-containing protein
MVLCMCRFSRQCHEGRKERGFTLIETVSVLAVIALVMLIAWPSVDGLISRWALRISTTTLIQTLRATRQQAMLEGRAYQIIFDTTDHVYTITGGGRPRSIRLHGRVRFGAATDVLGPPSQPTTPPPTGGVSFRREQLVFLPDGTLSPGPGTIYLVNRSGLMAGNATLAISVSIAGHLRRYEWEGRRWRVM